MVMIYEKHLSSLHRYKTILLFSNDLSMSPEWTTTTKKGSNFPVMCGRFFMWVGPKRCEEQLSAAELPQPGCKALSGEREFVTLELYGNYSCQNVHPFAATACPLLYKAATFISTSQELFCHSNHFGKKDAHQGNLFFFCAGQLPEDND